LTKSKAEYILKSMTRITHKRWEYFVVSRILHALSDDDLEFVTQQLVRSKSDGRRFLTDLYFPQLGVHLEIDEGHHAKNLEPDFLREQDIVQVTGHEIMRIQIYDDTGLEKPLKRVRTEVDDFVDALRDLKNRAVESKVFRSWDWELRYSATPIIERGYIDVDDNVTFRIQVEALRCFGFVGEVIRRGTWKIPDGSGDWVWFPRLYKHFVWNNEMTPDGKQIHAHALNERGRLLNARSLEKLSAAVSRGRGAEDVIVFAKAKDSLGGNLLRYVGTFQVNLGASNEDVVRFDLVRTREKIRLDLVRKH
jgi:very-short-patch-repair endonuclease